VKNLVLHVVLLVVTLACIGSVEAQTVVIGQCPLPTWADDATTKLGWVFSNPQDPGGTAPLTGWDIYVGDPPSPAWDFDAARLAWGAPGQWYIQIPNTEISTGFKRYWLCFVYERDPFYGGTYVFRNMSWTPFDSEQNVSMYEEWFDAAGNPTGTTHTVRRNLARSRRRGHVDGWRLGVGAPRGLLYGTATVFRPFR